MGKQKKKTIRTQITHKLNVVHPRPRLCPPTRSSNLSYYLVTTIQTLTTEYHYKNNIYIIIHCITTIPNPMISYIKYSHFRATICLSKYGMIKCRNVFSTTLISHHKLIIFHLGIDQTPPWKIISPLETSVVAILLPHGAPTR